jgi:hypothetical protein
LHRRKSPVRQPTFLLLEPNFPGQLSAVASPDPGFRSIRATTMTATLPVNSVWTRKITRLYRLSSLRPLVVLSRQLFVPLPLAVISLGRPLVHSSCQLVVTSPLLVLPLCRPLVLSSRRLVVALPLDAPPSRCLVVSLCRLSLSRRTSWLSHHHLSSSSRYTALAFSHHAGWLLCCLSLRRPMVVVSPLVVISLPRPIVVF